VTPSPQTPLAPRVRDIVLCTKAHFDAVASPLRIGMLECLHAIGPASVSDLARRLDRPADGLYHHIRKLLDAGLIREAGTRPAARHPERLYDAAAHTIRFPPGHETAAEDVARVWRLLSTGAERSLLCALRAGRVRFQGPHRNTTLRVETARLSREELAQVRRHLDDIRAIFEEARQRHGTPSGAPRSGTLQSLTFMLTPIPDSAAQEAGTS